MFSMIFFVFIAVILVAGFFAITWRKKNRVPLENDQSAKRPNRETSRSKSAFNEPSTGNIKAESSQRIISFRKKILMTIMM